jgi:hypothetical protein
MAASNTERSKAHRSRQRKAAVSSTPVAYESMIVREYVFRPIGDLHQEHCNARDEHDHCRQHNNAASNA